MKRFSLLFAAFALLSVQIWAQNVGIGTATPDNSAMLDVTSANSGLLVPRMPDHNVIASPANGLLVFNTTLNKFVYRSGAQWVVLDAWSFNNGNVGIGNVTAPTNRLEVQGNTLVNGNLTANNLNTTGTVTAGALTVGGNVNVTGTISGNGTIPIGGIIMWSGTIATIPTGWALCDGANGTPDLRDRFIVGAGSGYAPGNVGGTNSHTLAIDNLPPHTHTGTTSTNGAHYHDIEGSAAGGLAQRARTYVSVWGRTVDIDGTGDTGWGDPSWWRGLVDTNTQGDHNHTFVTNSTGSGVAVDHRPPYFALAFIMRIN
jgi:hypothetical protein